MELTTPRLRIRDFRAEDVPAAFCYLSDPVVMRYLQTPFTRAQAHAFILDCGLARSLVYALEDRTLGTLLGHVIFHPVRSGDYELGWVLSQAAWGLGYGRESGAALIRHAFAGLSAPGMVAETLPEHGACRRLLERLGLVPTGPQDGLLTFRLGKEAWRHA